MAADIHHNLFLIVILYSVSNYNALNGTKEAELQKLVRFAQDYLSCWVGRENGEIRITTQINNYETNNTRSYTWCDSIYFVYKM